MLDLLHVRKTADQLIVAAPEPVHERIFLAAGLDADDDLIAVLPLMDILGDQLHRILEVGHHGDHAVACHLEDPIIRRIELTEIPGIENSLDLRVLFAQLPQKRSCAVRGVVVNEHQLIVVHGKFAGNDVDDGIADGSHVFFFVVAWDQYADFFHFVSVSFFYSAFRRLVPLAFIIVSKKKDLSIFIGFPGSFLSLLQRPSPVSSR